MYFIIEKIQNYLLAYKKLSLFTMAGFILLTSCAIQKKQTAFDPKSCLETVPGHVKGLKIIEGPRTEKSIIRDMVPIVCNARVLFRNMNKKGESVEAGYIIFKVLVEYTGEVYGVNVEKKTIQSEEFISRISDFIMDTDFAFWGEDDRETIFLYPMKFAQ